MKRKTLVLLSGIAAILCSCGSNGGSEESQPVEEPLCEWGFKLSEYRVDSTSIKKGDTFSGLMDRLGVKAADARTLASLAKGTLNVNNILPGKAVEAFYKTDSLRPDWIVYHNNKITATIFCLQDTLLVKSHEREVEIRECKADVTIKTSLWVDMTNAGAPAALIAELADIYAWTVDFFALQAEDRFRVLYTERWCGDEFIDVHNVNFAVYTRQGCPEEFAIRFDQGDGGNLWWNEKGESLRKAFLKAPLKFNRVSSGFTYRRKHPVTGRVQPHTGVDYAAPKGTPVVALGDGTVTFAAYKGAGGNTVKIRHNSVYTTGYLHLSRFGKGIKSGTRVKQGQVIGYVGSTGRSTGPHLDFRVWKNGSPINPLTMKSPSAVPIKSQNKAALDSVFRAQFAIIKQQ